MIIVLATLLANLAVQARPVPAGQFVSGPEFEGVIMTVSGKSGKGESALELWTPSKRDILELENRLSAYTVPQLRHLGVSKKLSEYKRQYVGYVKSGHREIVVQFFHQSTNLVKSGKWLRSMVLVDGGGDDYLRAWYNADTKKLREFWVNAPE